MARRPHIPGFDHLLATMVGNYRTWTVHAAALLAFARGVHPASRPEVMEFILTEFGYVDPATCAGVAAVEVEDIPPATYRAVHARIQPIVKAFCNARMRENPTELSFTRQVMEFLEKLHSDTERIVAFSLVLKWNTTPYVQLPPAIERYRTTPSPADDARMYERRPVRESYKVMIRAINVASSVSELAQVIYGIMSEHRDADEARFLLWKALHHQRATQLQGGSPILVVMGRELPDDEDEVPAETTHGHELCRRSDCTLCSLN